MTEIRTHAVARAAYERVDARRNCSCSEKKKYGALAHKLPGMILENGLAQATGFLVAKGKSEHFALLDDLSAVLRAAGAITQPNGPTFHETVIASDLEQTMRLTRRTLEASGWIKRYVQGVLRVDATGETAAGDEGAKESG